MNKQAIQYFKVGLVGVLAAVLAVGSALFLKNLFSRNMHLNAFFRDARGIKSGEVIQMAGVDIGQVEDVGLTPDNQAKLRLSIGDKFKIPVGSRFAIRSALVGNQSTLVVTPSTNPQSLKDGDTIQGDASAPLDEAVRKGTDFLDEARKTLESSQKLIARLEKTVVEVNTPARQRKLDQTLENIRVTTENLPVLERQVQAELGTLSAQANRLLIGLETTRKGADKSLGNVDKVIVGAGKLSDNVNATITENRSSLRSLLRSADEAASAVAGLTDQLKTTVGDPKLQANLAAATDNLVSITARLDAAATDFQRLSSDPRLAADVRETVSNLRETSSSVKNLAARIETIRLPGERRRPAETTSADPAPEKKAPVFSATSLLEPGLAIDSLYDTKIERLRFDANYTLLAGSKGDFYRAGLFDATYGNRLNLQLGHAFDVRDARAAYRYGLFAGKLGAGLDFRGGPLDFRFDFFDPNRFTVNARAKAYLNRDTAITAGIDSLGNGNRATLGIQIKR